MFLLGSGLEAGGHYINEGTTLLSNSQLRGQQLTRISSDRIQLNTGLARHNNRQTDRQEFKVIQELFLSFTATQCLQSLREE